MFFIDSPLEKELLKNDPIVTNPVNLNVPQSAAPVSPTSTPQASPLDNLRDIHLPENIDQFPSAIGWWILLALTVLTILFLVYRQVKKYRALKYLRAAKTELIQLNKQSISSKSVSELSALLKRVCLIYFPAADIAPLNGKNWWLFLNTTTNQEIYSNEDINLLDNSRYQKDIKIEQQDWDKLITKTEKCIERIVKVGIKGTDKNKVDNKSRLSMANGAVQ